MTAEQTLTILDVGHGNSAVLTDADGVLVVDTGPRNSLLQYLHDQGITKIDVVLLSHADEDHIGGLIGVLSSDSIEVGCVRLNTDSSQKSDVWDDLLYELNHHAHDGKIDFRALLTSGDSGAFDRGDISVEILGPSEYLASRGPGQSHRRSSSARITTNSISAVIRITKNNEPVALLPGDLDSLGLDDLLDNVADVHAPVLVFPHHGGLVGTGTDAGAYAARLCAAVEPKAVLFSTGRGEKRHRPLPEVVAAVRGCSPDIRIACTQLSKRCASSLPTNNPSHLNDVFAKGREHRKCCAGSLVIELGAKSRLWPPHFDHQEFIVSEAPTALCR